MHVILILFNFNWTTLYDARAPLPEEKKKKKEMRFQGYKSTFEIPKICFRKRIPLLLIEIIGAISDSTTSGDYSSFDSFFFQYTF